MISVAPLRYHHLVERVLTENKFIYLSNRLSEIEIGNENNFPRSKKPPLQPLAIDEKIEDEKWEETYKSEPRSSFQLSKSHTHTSSTRGN